VTHNLIGLGLNSAINNCVDLLAGQKPKIQHPAMVLTLGRGDELMDLGNGSNNLVLSRDNTVAGENLSFLHSVMH